MLVKTHLIITDQYDDYEVKYVAKLIDLTPSLTSRNSMSFVKFPINITLFMLRSLLL